MRISDWSSDVCSSDLQEGDIHSAEGTDGTFRDRFALVKRIALKVGGYCARQRARPYAAGSWHDRTISTTLRRYPCSPPASRRSCRQIGSATGRESVCTSV